MSEPSKAAMEAAVRISLELDSRGNAMDDVVAAEIIDQIMKPERDAASKCSEALICKTCGDDKEVIGICHQYADRIEPILKERNKKIYLKET